MYTKTDKMHQCIICDVDIYHDKHFIESHLANHTISLKKYRDRWGSRWVRDKIRGIQESQKRYV